MLVGWPDRDDLVHPGMNAALIQDRMAHIIGTFGIREGLTWKHEGARLTGQEQAKLRTALGNSRAALRKVIQKRDDAPAELLYFGERVHLAPAIGGDE